MTCGEVREYLFAFLDNELDAPLSMELQRHIDCCAQCAREVEIERTIRKQLAGALDQSSSDIAGDDAALGHAVSRAVSSAPVRFRLRRRAIAATSVAAALLLGAALWIWMPALGNRPTGISFADLVVEDFQHFRDDGMRVHFASGRPGEVAPWLRDQTGLAVTLPPAAPDKYRLVGGRKCKIAGRPAAFAVYEIDGAIASVVVARSDGLAMEDMALVEHDGGKHWLDRCRGHTVVACRRGDLIYAAVSTLPEKRLLCLMTGDIHEGD